MNQENGAYEAYEAALDTVSQVENIKDQTREFEYSLQDNNRTLKVFKNVDE